MTKKAKLEQFDAVQRQRDMLSMALNLYMNGECSPGITLAESTFDAKAPDGNEYVFRFYELANGYSYAICTFRCAQTGQSGYTTVHCVEDIEDDYRTGNNSTWHRIAITAIWRWREARRAA